MQPFLALFVAALLPFAVPQTLTTTDQLGETIVEVITIDANGLPTTSIIETLTPGPTTTTVTTTDNVGETVVEVIQGDGEGDTQTQTIQTITPDAGAGAGPVGQPAQQGTAGGPTPYTYTTTDANGNTIAVVATFTPSTATTIMPSATFKATVLNYSQYLASYATQVQTQNAQAQNANAAAERRPASWGLWLSSAVVGVLSGAYLVYY